MDTHPVRVVRGNIMHQVVKGASPMFKLPITRSLVNGLHTGVKLQIIMHVEKNRMGIEYSHDKSDGKDL